MKLKHAARVVRSKNAGPLMLTVDLLFDDDDHFRAAMTSAALTPEALAKRLGRDVRALRVVVDARARAIKLVMPRQCVSGSPGDNDVYGAQQHAAFLDIEL